MLHGATGVGKSNLIQEIISEVKQKKIEGLEDVGIMSHSFDVPYKFDHLKHFKKARSRFLGLGKKQVVAFMDEVHFGDDKDVLGISAMWDKRDLHSVVFVQIQPKAQIRPIGKENRGYTRYRYMKSQKILYLI